MSRVIQVSVDIVDNDIDLSKVVKILEDSGVEVMGSDITASWGYDNYISGCKSDE